jgi:hypothetical protein
MKLILPFLFIFLFFVVGHAQDDERQTLRGQVLYRNTIVPNENVINATSETATITNSRGEFAIAVKKDDELVFTAVNYQLKVVKVTDSILKNNRLVVEVNEKITELDEVIVTPEQQERFLAIKSKVLQEQYEYEIDRSTEVRNTAFEDNAPIQTRDGVNFVGIYKALAKLMKKDREEEKEPLKMSEVLRQVYDDEFFVLDLNLPQDKINAFLFYLDTKKPERTLLKKDNEFQLIDFLVTHSNTFRQELDSEK